MEQTRVWVGLDLGLRRSRICIIDADGVPCQERDCDTDLRALEEALEAFGPQGIEMIAVEAAGETHIVRKLRTAGFPVAMFESRKASKFMAMRRSKTDASDARGLADLARLGCNSVSQVFLKSRECERLRSMIVMRKRLVHMRVALDGALRARFRMHGLQLTATTSVDGMSEQVRARIADVRASENVDLGPELEPVLALGESLRACIRKFDADIAAAAANHPVCRLLMEVPGVGPICALSFYTAIEAPDRFRRTADVGAYLGLVPRRYQSGELSRSFGITKTGSKLTRTHLVTAATVFGTRAPDCDLKTWYLGLRGRIGPARARVALARKLSILLLLMWKTGAHFEPRNTTCSPAPSA